MTKVARMQVDTQTDRTMIDDLRSAIQDELRSMTLAFNTDEVRRMLRVEVDPAHELAILRTSPMYWLQQGDVEGPCTFEGVDVYAVRKLPEPGWRVVNPFLDN